MRYEEFVDFKSNLDEDHGFDPTFVPDCLFDFQRSLVEWAVRKGRAAVFADCGLGKSLIELVWAENVARKTGKPTLILTPLAVAQQTHAEGEKFGIEANVSREGAANGRIVITNYERLHLFDHAAFGGVVCDESSILKNFDGKRRGAITAFMRKMPFRLLCTATAAPNDYIELGTSSEALGYLGHMDMLGRFFKNDMNNADTKRRYAQQGGGAPKWRFKGHSESAFWRWVCSWARAIRRPSDLGFDDTRFKLPPLTEHESVVSARKLPAGRLFDPGARGLWEEREEQRRTLSERCERAAEIANSGTDPIVLWCHRNDEGDLLEKLIPDAVQVSGSDSNDAKEAAFLGFANGSIRALVIKPKIGALGLNWQHCARMTFFPSHSFEQYYQAVRRCWRFGQTREVIVDIVTTEGGQGIRENLRRKATQADRMFDALVSNMNDSLRIRSGQKFAQSEEVPSWLSSTK